MLTFIICLSTMVKGNKPKDARCKRANQTCYIISLDGTETSKSGRLTVDFDWL